MSSRRVRKRAAGVPHGVSPLRLLTLAMVSALQSVAFGAAAAEAQAVSDEKSKPKQLDAVSVVGSQIAGGGAQAALPVISIDAEQLDATGATDGNELIRSLPQMGDVTWNPTWLGGGNSNAARGDIGSISLRSIGASNTLLLINGRRSVIHPTTATVDGAISTTTYNSNAIPMFGLERMDMLLDGAAAIYGSDAIAGVVNVVTRQNLADGGGVQFEYGTVSGSHREDYQLNGYFGHDFAEGRGNVSVMYNFSHRTPQYFSDQWYTATSGRTRRPDGSLVPGGTDSGLSTTTPYGRFQKYSDGTTTGGYYTVNANGEAVTGARPAVLVDSNAIPGLTLSPGIKRGNFFGNARFDLTDNLQLFGELGYYQAKSKSWISPASTSTTQPTYIDTSVATVPAALAAGADAISISNYLIADGGIRPVRVDNYQTRALVGLRGWTDGGWNWETALLYSKSHADDDMVGVDVSKFVDAVNNGSYDPFNGGGTRTGDQTPSDASSFMVHTHRKTTAELALWDFKINRPDLFSWYAGDIGLAAGVEVRYESLRDNRDTIIDGTYKYTDWYTGTVYDSNFFGHSSTPDSYGSRNVKSAFVEVAVPFVSADQHIPLVKSLDVQLAGRYESYSDVGDVAKPKLALAWQVNDSLLLRGSVSEGFKAPNLELVNSSVLYRFNGYDDAIRCAALVAGASYDDYLSCDAANALPGTGISQNYSVRSVRTGNQELKPELSKNYSYGFVFSPDFIPDTYGKFSFGMDWWKIEIENPIGMLNDQNALYYDAYLRVVEGSYNPNVVRFDPTEADIAQFSGSGLDPVGEVNYVNATYTNMSPINAEGVDYTFDWRLRDTAWGDFSLIINAARIKSYTQDPTVEEALIQSAIDAGLLNLMISSIGATNLVGRYSANVGVKPEWKASATLVWKYDNWTVRVRDQYTDSVVYGLYGDGSDFVVPSTQRWNLSVKRDFTKDFLNGFSVEAGARNLFDKDPPLNSSGDYLASVYEPYGAYYYMSIQKTW
ncbi:TonB-dependent receptor plug domain-containing protein [Pseudoxanthomonas spadix]|nr:TonB-dependent receptor [Pseudoxanthomonas spadix]